MIKNFLIRAKKKIYREFLFLIYRPKQKWEVAYVNDLFEFGVGGIWDKVKMNVITTIDKQKDMRKYPWSKALCVLDSLMCCKLLGAEDEDYFRGDYYTRNWKYRKRYITRQRLNFLKRYMNSPEQFHWLDNKSEFATIWSDYFGRNWVELPDCGFDAFFNKFRNCQKIIAKPIDGRGGKGIAVISLENQSIEEIYHDLCKMSEKMIIEEYIEQKGFLHDVNPTSLNTIRVITTRNNEQVTVLQGRFRAGGKDAFVDNLHSGGVAYSIDIATGALFYGERFFDSHRYTEHPSTGISVTGQKIPNWDEVIQICLSAHKIAPEGLDFIGWDVCVSTDGITIIEGNAGPGFGALVNDQDDPWGAVKAILTQKDN